MSRLPVTSTSCETTWLDIFNACGTRREQRALLETLSEVELDRLRTDWPTFARADQLPPGFAAAPGRRARFVGGAPDWTAWLVLGGRGAGKTRTGAEWVRAMSAGVEGFATVPAGRIALVAETMADVRDVMVEGVSGLLSVHPRRERPRWEPSRRRLLWPNGAVATAFSAEDPESLRGPQFDAAWLDELAKWRLAQETWDMLQFALRLGPRPRQIVTTTPRPVPLIKRLLADPAAVVTRAATRANALNLAPAFLDTIVSRYAGTRLGRQELDGEMVEERPDALWSRAALEAIRIDEAPPLARVVVAVDPPASSSRRADSCGIVAAGIDRDGLVFVLADATLQGVRPSAWAEVALALFHRLEADMLVVETNQGGEMAEAVLREADPSVPVRPVRATRGKYLRAEPVAQLYEQGRVRHVGPFPRLEDEMCDFGAAKGPGGRGGGGYQLSSGRSPDRLDALVWAITTLALGPRTQPRLRRL
jgi:phage terminase large subunit-like protein